MQPALLVRIRSRPAEVNKGQVPWRSAWKKVKSGLNPRSSYRTIAVGLLLCLSLFKSLKGREGGQYQTICIHVVEKQRRGMYGPKACG